MIRVNTSNPAAKVLHERLAERVDLKQLPDDLCLVLGGDGYMLESIREVGASHVFLGINAGRVGFLLNDPEDFEAMVDAL